MLETNGENYISVAKYVKIHAAMRRQRRLVVVHSATKTSTKQSLAKATIGFFTKGVSSVNSLARMRRRQQLAIVLNAKKTNSKQSFSKATIGCFTKRVSSVKSRTRMRIW